MHSGKYTVDYMIRLDDDQIFIRLRFNGRVFDIEFGPEDLHDPDPVNPTDSQPFEQRYLDALQRSFSDEGSEGADEVDEATEVSELQRHFDPAASLISSECGCEEDPVISFAVAPFLTHCTFETFAPESSTPCLNTLHDVLHPPVLSFRLHIEDEN
ncbi:hypothetical protein A1O3_03420 [Capronia epimyces CBS 606.96]|uniref:Uncharacterized protein n=1 Tax=Capronia epimyces CBS 606.96 TaxID=1182542 RepID=W9YW11_9EURO|nr:uncharacterized protein A1O3_03420 [Capronia epimyces CBS 606.96]EXJ86469.1 hypothetical protein A1O3_03420 [Capronia epimyces CBS 606.96]